MVLEKHRIKAKKTCEKRESLYQAFPAVLKEYRALIGKGIKDILDYIEIARTTYYLWESGKSLPEPERFELLVNFFVKHLPGIPEREIREDFMNAYRKDREIKKEKFLKQKSIAKLLRLYKKLTDSGVVSAEKTEETAKVTKIAEALGIPYLSLPSDERLVSFIIENPRLKKVLEKFFCLDEESKSFLLNITEMLIDFILEGKKEKEKEKVKYD